MPLRNRNGKWNWRFQFDGHTYSGATDLAATERNRSKAQAEELEARRLVTAGRSAEIRLVVIPFSKAADLYIDWCRGEYSVHMNTARRIETSFASLRLMFRSKPVSSITAGDIEEFKTWRRSAHQVREVTIRHDLHALSGFFQFAMRSQWCSANPVERVEIPSDSEAVRMRVLSPAEEHRYFAAALRYPALYDLGRIMILQGARPDEVMRARVEDVQGDQWVIRDGKSTAARRVLVLTSEARGIMEARAMSPGGWLFAGKSHGTRLTKLNGSHDKVLAKLNPEGSPGPGLRFVLYDLRHTFATRMAASGCPITTLAAILGHGNLRTVMRYVHPTATDVRQAMRTFEAGLVVGQKEKAGRLT